MPKFLILLLALIIAGCEQHAVKPSDPAVSGGDKKTGLHESSDPSRYQHAQDFAPLRKLNPDEIQDARPRLDPIRAAGNKSPYMVFGEVYHVMESSKGYKEKGGASWYGLKFHGHNTSNGEVYDIHGMTAAHKTLPLPSYAKVTNLANGRSAIVRVNDRGPFHAERIIDLSYAAATKLGYIEQGVAQVLVEAIDVEQWLAEENAKLQPVIEEDMHYLQIGAYSNEATALQMRQRLLQQFSWPIAVEAGQDGLHRVKMGPVPQSQYADLSQELTLKGYPVPLKLNP